MTSRPRSKVRQDLEYIKLAISEAAKCQGEDNRMHPKVGAVVVRDGEVLATAYRGEFEAGEHAEFTALEKKLTGESLVGATIYTTLEPCTSRNHPKVPCAQRLVERKVRRVVIGMLDPNEQICGRGLWHLRESGIETDLFSHEHMAATEELNREFIRIHRPPLRLKGETEKLGAIINASPPDAGSTDDDEYRLIQTMIDAAERLEFTLAEAAFRELQDRSSTEDEKQKLQLIFYKLKVEHSQDPEARTKLLEATNSDLGLFATELLASLDRRAGNVHSATERLALAVDRMTDPDSKAKLALNAAEIYRDTDSNAAATDALQQVALLDLSPGVQAQVFRSLAHSATGEGTLIQRAAFLTRAASIEPNASNLFAAAYALHEARLFALSAIHYQNALNLNSKDSASMNNLGVTLRSLGLQGMSSKLYRQAAEEGHTLAMSNLAQEYIGAGFYDEAEKEIDIGRRADHPHENIGSAMVALAKAKESEREKWQQARKHALTHKALFNDLAKAFVQPLNPEALARHWTVKGAVTALHVADIKAEATWEESSRKQRFRGSIIGGALVGELEQWNSIWDKYEPRGTLAMFLRPNGRLSGILLDSTESLQYIEWLPAPAAKAIGNDD